MFKIERGWAAVSLPVLHLAIENQVDIWTRCAAHPVISTHYSPEVWKRARRASEFARSALQELAKMHEIELEPESEVDEHDPDGAVKYTPPAGPTPLWMLARKNNPGRQRNEALHMILHREMDILDRIVEGISDADKELLLEEEMRAEEVAEGRAEEERQYAAIRAAQAVREATKARVAQLPDAEPAAAEALFPISERTELEVALNDIEASLSCIEQRCANDDLDPEEYGAEGGLERLRYLVPETRAIVQQLAPMLGLFVPRVPPARIALLERRWIADLSPYVQRADVQARAASDPWAAKAIGTLSLVHDSLQEIALTLDWQCCVWDDD